MTVRDDGAGGADPRRGTGLRGPQRPRGGARRPLRGHLPPAQGRPSSPSCRWSAREARARHRSPRLARRRGAWRAATAARRSPRRATSAASLGWRSPATSRSTSGCSTAPTRACGSPPARRSIDRIETEVVGDVLRVSTKSRGLDDRPGPARRRLDQPRRAGAAGAARRRPGRRDAQRPVRPSRSSCASTAPGDVQARGRVDDLEMEVDGSAETDLGDLATQNASVRIDGSGDADLRVARSLELIVEGSGDVTYRGRPSVSSRLEGSGDVSADWTINGDDRPEPGRRVASVHRFWSEGDKVAGRSTRPRAAPSAPGAGRGA